VTGRRLRGDAGFTLPELLTTMWIAMVILLAGFALLDFVMKRANETEQRVEATQRGRIAMDLITRQLRSEVCLDANGTSPILDGSATQVTFYADLGNSTASSLPEKHVLTFNAAAGEITESVAQPIAGNPVTWAAPKTRKVLANVTQDGTTPVFQYFPYDPTRSASLTALTTPLAKTDIPKVARIRISYRTTPLRNARAPVAVPLSDDVYLRVVNPNPPEPVVGTYNPTPSCS